MTTAIEDQTISLRSHVSGRDRWEVPCLCGNSRWAAAVELVLRGEEGVLQATANPATGRVLVTYDPTLLAAPVEVLLRQSLTFGPIALADLPAGTGTFAKSAIGAYVSAELGCTLVKLAFAGCPAFGATAAAVLFVVSASRARARKAADPLVGPTIGLVIDEPTGIADYEQGTEVVQYSGDNRVN